MKKHVREMGAGEHEWAFTEYTLWINNELVEGECWTDIFKNLKVEKSRIWEN